MPRMQNDGQIIRLSRGTNGRNTGRALTNGRRREAPQTSVPLTRPY